MRKLEQIIASLIVTVSLAVSGCGHHTSQVKKAPQQDPYRIGRTIKVENSPLPPFFFYSIALGDTNWDKKPDLIATDASNQLYLLTNEGNNTFVFKEKLPRMDLSFVLTNPIAACNDKSGHLWIYGEELDGEVYKLEETKYYFEETGEPILHTDSSRILYLSYTPSIAAGDINGDGKIDFLEVTKWGKIYVYHNEGNGVFVKDNHPIFSLHPKDIYYYYGPPIAAGDLNGDGRADLLIKREDGEIDVYYNHKIGNKIIFQEPHIHADGYTIDITDQSSSSTSSSSHLEGKVEFH